MSIIRIEKNGDYTILANAPLNDERLSWEARGLLAYLLSKPNNWKVNSRALVKKAPAGRAKVQRILRELEEHGYLERRKVRGEHGRFEWESVVREIPVPPAQDNIDDQPAEQLEVEAEAQQPQAEADSTMAQKPSHGEEEQISTMAQFSADGKTADGKTADGKTADGKPSQLINTVLTNTDLTTTDRIKPRKRKVTAAASNTRTRGERPQAQTSAAAPPAAAKSALPEEITAGLKAIGWRGPVDDVLRYWQAEPDRVENLVWYAQKAGWGGGLLRNALRSGEWPPEFKPGSEADRARWREEAARLEALPEAAAPAAQAASPPESLPLAGAAASVTDADVPPEVRRWWAFVLGQLAREMPKSAFDTWVRPTQLAAWEAENGQGALTVTAANEYAQRWLTERVTKILERKLTGLAGHPVAVQFVVLEDAHA